MLVQDTELNDCDHHQNLALASVESVTLGPVAVVAAKRGNPCNVKGQSVPKVAIQPIQ